MEVTMMPNDEIQTSDVKEIYMQYLQEANRLRKEYLRLYKPYMWISFVLLFIGAASCSAGLFVPSSLGTNGVKVTSWLYWLGLITGTVIVLAGNYISRKSLNELVQRVAASKRGFADFFKLYLNRRYWPEEMVTGEKYSQFLSIIGKSESS
jgi:hypothetical protein